MKTTNVIEKYQDGRRLKCKRTTRKEEDQEFNSIERIEYILELSRRPIKISEKYQDRRRPKVLDIFLVEADFK